MRQSTWLPIAGLVALTSALLDACVIPIPIPILTTEKPSSPLLTTEKPSPPPPKPTRSDSMSPEERRILEAHNRYRAEVGVPPLFWSKELAAHAQEWATHLADDSHALKHSHRPGVGENLAMWTTGFRTPTEMIALWAGEKSDFVRGAFPDVNRRGDWVAVGHYTQMIWRDTAQLGCGIASGGGDNYLVCEYSPQGNIIGEVVY